MRFSKTQMSKLPYKAREKAYFLCEQSEHHLGSVRQLHKRRDEVHAQLNGIVLARAELIVRTAGRSLSPETEKDFQSQRKAVKSQISRFNAVIPEFTHTWETMEALLKRCASLIDSHSEFQIAKPVPPGKSLEAVRSNISRLKQERAEVMSAPLPREQYLAATRASLEEEILFGQAHFDGRVHNGDPFRLEALIRSDGRSTAIGAGAFILSLFREEIFAKLSDLIPLDGPETLDADQRAAKLTKIDADILRFERSEEALIEAANAEGNSIARRIDANPLAVLGVDL